MLKKHKLIFSLLAVSSVIVASLPLHAVDNYPYFDPKKDGYNIKAVSYTHLRAHET